jgi:hypothetical protein
MISNKPLSIPWRSLVKYCAQSVWVMNVQLGFKQAHPSSNDWSKRIFAINSASWKTSRKIYTCTVILCLSTSRKCSSFFLNRGEAWGNSPRTETHTRPCPEIIFVQTGLLSAPCYSAEILVCRVSAQIPGRAPLNTFVVCHNALQVTSTLWFPQEF